MSARVLELDTISADFELAGGVEVLALIHQAGGEINDDEMLLTEVSTQKTFRAR